jgi:nucleotide-binding universal stress UspA family protein
MTLKEAAMFKRILVCLDGSELAERVLPYVAEEASHSNARVILFQATAEPTFLSPGIPGAPPMPVGTESLMKQAQREEQQAANYLDKLAKQLQAKNLKVETATAPGPAGKTIVAYAENNKIDLIAIATHGRGGLGRAVFGSVADHVLRESKLPILVIKP